VRFAALSTLSQVPCEVNAEVLSDAVRSTDSETAELAAEVIASAVEANPIKCSEIFTHLLDQIGTLHEPAFRHLVPSLSAFSRSHPRLARRLLRRLEDHPSEWLREEVGQLSGQLARA
jgi:hypothetical protein